MIAPALATQLQALRTAAEQDPAPLQFWGRTDWPDGTPTAAAQTAESFQLALQRLGQMHGCAALQASRRRWRARISQRRPDAPIPIGVVALDLRRPGAGMQQRLRVAAEAGQALDPAPQPADAFETGTVFMAAPMLHDQWGCATVGLRSRVVQWRLDRRFIAAPTGVTPPELTGFDAGDGLGVRPIPPDGVISASYPAGLDQVQLSLHARFGAHGELIARSSIGFHPQPVAPLPDLTLPLSAPGGLTGSAWVFLAPGRRTLQHPLLVAEGFPGGYACDYMHDLLNQFGLLDGWRQAGHDVVIVGFDQGGGPIEGCSALMVEAIRQVRRRTTAPMVVGGVSMGGLVARHALCWLEHHGEAHGARLFFTVDTPHQGATTNVPAQWFAQRFADQIGGMGDLAALLDSPANQQLVRNWVHRDAQGHWRAGVSPMREQFMAGLVALGHYPQQPKRLAVSCGRGSGKPLVAPGQPLLSWQDAPWIDVTLHAPAPATPTDPAGPAAFGHCRAFRFDAPEPDLVVTDDVAWDTSLGSTNVHVAIVGALAGAMGEGSVQVQTVYTTGIPMASALDLPLPADAESIPDGLRGPFDVVLTADADLPHLVLTPALRDALLAHVGPAVATAPAASSAPLSTS